MNYISRPKTRTQHRQPRNALFCFFHRCDVYVIYEQRERVFHRDIQTRGASVLSIVFECLVYPGETIARVVYMASQMNRDVTECFGLPI